MLKRIEYKYPHSIVLSGCFDKQNNFSCFDKHKRVSEKQQNVQGNRNKINNQEQFRIK